MYSTPLSADAIRCKYPRLIKALERYGYVNLPVTSNRAVNLIYRHLEGDRHPETGRLTKSGLSALALDGAIAAIRCRHLKPHFQMDVVVRQLESDPEGTRKTLAMMPELIEHHLGGEILNRRDLSTKTVFQIEVKASPAIVERIFTDLLLPGHEANCRPYIENVIHVAIRDQWAYGDLNSQARQTLRLKGEAKVAQASFEAAKAQFWQRLVSWSEVEAKRDAPAEETLENFGARQRELIKEKLESLNQEQGTITLQTQSETFIDTQAFLHWLAEGKVTLTNQDWLDYIFRGERPKVPNVEALTKLLQEQVSTNDIDLLLTRRKAATLSVKPT